MLKNLSIIKIICVVIVVTFIVLCLEIFGIMKSKNDVSFVIPNGSGLNEIINILDENNLINSRLIFKLLAYSDASEFKAGEHTFESRNYFSIIKELKSTPKINGVTVTIPEGFEQREIALLLEKNGLCTAEEFNNEAKLKNFTEYWFLNGITKRNYELEGYLFPDTYNFSKEEGVHNIIARMLSNFESKITDEMRNRAKALNRTFDEIITMASIVEREAADPKEYKTVAGVFYNRLNNKTEAYGYLQSCATVQYILKERKYVLSIADTKIDSPYNTYKYQGLPVGPVASPGLETINAALYPSETDYLYFVADGKGKHYFAKTVEEHEINKRKAGY